MTKATIFIDEKGVVQVTDDGASIKAAFAAMEPPPVGRKVLALVPATLLSSQEAEIKRLKTVSDVLQDSAYLAGAKAGWNAAQADDPNAAFEQIVNSRAGYLKPLAALTPLPEGGNG